MQQQLKDPHTILVLLLSAALGFATAENIEYVFGSSSDSSILPGATVLEGELLILLVRILMPVHAICAVIQAVSLSKSVLNQQPASLFSLLFPAILLHGSFDFVLFLLGALEFTYELDSLNMLIATALVAFSLVIIGTAYAYRS